MTTKTSLPPFTVPLTKTDPEWTKVAIGNLPQIFQDHMHCERKAAQSALSLLRAYPTRENIARVVTRLAHEETAHVIQMENVIRTQGLKPAHDLGDDYAKKLRKLIRKDEPGRLLDTLTVFALIEARSAERLHILGQHISDAKIAKLYQSLAVAEERHRDSFLQLIAEIFGDSKWHRVKELAQLESEIIEQLPLRARIH